MSKDPNSSKYMISATITANGVVDRSDVVGAIFGQTEGLLGDELDLRDLQKSGRMGRIEVDIKSSKGKSKGDITISSSMDQVETSVFAAALETVERVGPCNATLKVTSLEDTRAGKHDQIVERARELLVNIVSESRSTGGDITDSVCSYIRIIIPTVSSTPVPEDCPVVPIMSAPAASSPTMKPLKRVTVGM